MSPSRGASPIHADFTNLNTSVRPQALVQSQDALNHQGETQAYKRRMYELLAPQPGDTLLDAGCGMGGDVFALAVPVGPTGRVVGVDRGEVMVAEARTRAKGLGLPVEFQVGDITRLDFPDDTFDGCRADRVLHHLDDPARALAELARVARPGGRVVVAEPDFEMGLFDHPDRALARRMVDFTADATVRNGRVARHLYALFRKQGLADVAVEGFVVVLTDLPTARAITMHDAVLERAVAAGVFTDAEAATWVAGLEAAERDGCFLMSGGGYIVSGRKA